MKRFEDFLNESKKNDFRIETLYNYLKKNNYPHKSYDVEYDEKEFEIEYKGMDLIVFRSNNMDRTDEYSTDTFSYHIKIDDKTYNNYLKNVPNIIYYLKNK